jgi:23S rRNA (pseudouridine1915-N3)-methyltransferase
MRLTLAAVTARKQGLRPGAGRDLFEEYLGRIAQYVPAETVFSESEGALLEKLRRDAGRTQPYLVLLDSRGKSLSSETFAERLRELRDGGTQQIVFAIGPASGWSPATRTAAPWLLSLGAMTLPHELALVVLAEQLYRAQTILAGHPYHCGH